MNRKNKIKLKDSIVVNRCCKLNWYKFNVALLLISALLVSFGQVNGGVINEKLGRAFFNLYDCGLNFFGANIYADESLEALDDSDLGENDSESEQGNNPDGETTEKFTAQEVQRESFEFDEEPIWDADNDRLLKEAEAKLAENFKSLQYSKIEFNGDKSENGKILASIQLTNNFNFPLTAWNLHFKNEAGEKIEFKELKDNCFTTLPDENSVYVDTRLPRELSDGELDGFKLYRAEAYLLQDYKNLIHIIYDYEKDKIIYADRSRAYYHEGQDVNILKGADLEFYYEDGRYQADWTSPYSSGLATISWFFVDKNNNTLMASNARTLYYGQTQYDVFYEVNGRHEAGNSLSFDFASMKFAGMRVLLEYDPSHYYYYDANLNLFY